MAETSFPFDNTTTWGEDSWRRWGRVFTQDGVQGGYGSTGLLVSTGGSSIDIAAGYASVQSAVYNNDSSLNKTVNTNGGGSARPDRVVLRYDPTANSITAVVREGTVGAAAPPTLTQSVTGQWDIPLARWSRAAGGGIGSMIDERQFMDRSGTLVMADAAVTTAVTLSALVPSPWTGMRVLTLPSAKEYRWSGVYWERVDAQPLAEYLDVAPSGPTLSTWQAVGPVGGFTAPLSGRVRITITAFITAPSSNGSCSFTARVTGPSGFDYLPTVDSADQVAVGGGDGFTRATVTVSYMVSSLSPGSTYTVTGYGKVTIHSGHQVIDSKRIVVERA